MDTAPHLVPTDEWRKRAVAARRRLGLSQQQLAKRIGGSQPSVSQMESGSKDSAERSPYVAMMSQVLGIAWPVYDDNDELLRAVADLELLKSEAPELFSAHVNVIRTAAGSKAKQGDK